MATSRRHKAPKDDEYGYWLDCDYMSGACYSFENSKRHLLYADMAQTQKDYGIGVSHLVLGIEEMIKSLLLISSYVYPYLLKPNEKQDLFIKHDYKHLNIKEFLTSLSDPNIESCHQNPFDGGSDNKLQTVAHFLSKGLRLGSLQPIEVKQLIELMNKANTLKNCGFYVDYRHKWVLPDNISGKQFLKYHDLAKRLRSYIEPVFTIPITDERFQRFIDGNWI
ncbi:hypothetical protein [Chitinophaga japonensis]|uniref:AbiV family abortive infection protein n=1 Tax=Chitinophaga japonensis TaxID=104662 RepID=A0A562T714_CHIJA|nr:hypothetical protein [Chitinophaga japonensis]TWI89282.1 AbiV family abortive infection protein [Chitinophaga japonensis]